MSRKLIVEDKICPECGIAFARKRYKRGVLEPVSTFMSRKFCSSECRFQYQRKFAAQTKKTKATIPMDEDMPDDGHIWADIKGYEGLYQVSRDGIVRSLSKKVWNGKGYKKLEAYILKPNILKKGYFQVSLVDANGKRNGFQIHRLVASAFIPNPKEYPQVNHINGNKQDNRVENLEWVNNSINQIHAWRTGLQKQYHNQWENRMTARVSIDRYNLDGTFDMHFDTITEAAKYIGEGHSSTLYKILAPKSERKSNIYKGYIYKRSC